MSQGFLLEGFKALGTVWFVEIFEEISSEKKECLQKEIETMLVHFENKYSRFSSTSLLSRFNKERTIPFDDDLFNMLTLANDASLKSDDIFDVYIEDKLVEKGYGKRGEVKAFQPNKKTFWKKESDTLVLVGDKSIDLGGIGKGYLIDKLARYLQVDCGIKEFLINGGGDMYGTHHNDKAIEVYLQDPVDTEKYIGCISIKNEAFCSSSSYVRVWQKDGHTKNHFISPRGEEVWAASFVTGTSAVIADIAATVLCITSGKIEKTDMIAQHFGVVYLVKNHNADYFGTLVISM